MFCFIYCSVSVLFFLFPVTKPSSAEVEVAEKAACRKKATVFRVEQPVNNVSFKTFVNPS